MTAEQQQDQLDPLAQQFYEQVVENRQKLAALVLHGSQKTRNELTEQTKILSYCSVSERPLFLSYYFKTTAVKSYLMTALRQPLYKPVVYAIPFGVGEPKAFLNAMHVQKTRLLADATGEARQDLFQATRDKLYHTFLPTPAPTPVHAPVAQASRSPYSPLVLPPEPLPAILSLLGIPYWLVQFTRTQKGEGRKWTGELPQPPSNWDKQFCVATDDLDVKPVANKTNLATKPYKRNASEIVLTDELIEEL